MAPGLAGRPRAGSTLLCQLLATHPDIHCEGHSSPWCNALVHTRRSISHDSFLLAQLDTQFDTRYGHLKSAMQGFLHGWYAGCGKPVVVDKSRGGLPCIELLLRLNPSARLLVPIREPGQIYGSIERQHQKTILLDFIDSLAELDRLGRADALDKSIGAPLLARQAVQDLSRAVREPIYFVKYEELLQPPHAIPARVPRLVEQACRWYYDWFYPEQPRLKEGHCRAQLARRRLPGV